MITRSIITETKLPGFEPISKGKVREIYDLGEDQLLFVTTDRISAFDVIMNEGVPGKGIVLNKVSRFWFKKSKHIIDNHYITGNIKKFPSVLKQFHAQLEGRSMIVKKCKPLPIEFVVRGYLAGSAWKEYEEKGEVCGVKLPAGLKKNDKLPEPIFTPATKAEEGHDENITFEEAAAKIGERTADYLREISIELYNFGNKYLEEKGLVMADTKFEFGRLSNGETILIDEVMTPDSSRFWPKKLLDEGKEPVHFDKQVLRDWLEEQDWDKTPPAPPLSEEVINETYQRYQDIGQVITSRSMGDR